MAAFGQHSRTAPARMRWCSTGPLRVEIQLDARGEGTRLAGQHKALRLLIRLQGVVVGHGDLALDDLGAAGAADAAGAGVGGVRTRLENGGQYGIVVRGHGELRTAGPRWDR